MPLAGIRLRLTAMLMSDCKPNSDDQAGDGKRMKSSSLFSAMRQAAHDDEGEDQHDQRRQRMMPNSSAATAKMKSAWASGRCA